MKKVDYWKFCIALLLIIIMTLTSLCLGDESSNDANSKKKLDEIPKEELKILYLARPTMRDTPPGNDKSNQTELSAENQVIFGQNIFDRKFDDKIKPELNLWLDTNGKKGIKLEFEIYFQAVEDSTLLPNKYFKAIFSNYTTNGTTDIIYLRREFLKYEGTPFDIKSGSENWCSVTFKISRTDNATDSKLHIYHGAENRVSFITIPYNETQSSHEYEQEKDEEPTPGFIGTNFIIILLVVCIILYIQKQSRK